MARTAGGADGRIVILVAFEQLLLPFLPKWNAFYAFIRGISHQGMVSRDALRGIVKFQVLFDIVRRWRMRCRPLPLAVRVLYRRLRAFDRNTICLGFGGGLRSFPSGRTPFVEPVDVS